MYKFFKLLGVKHGDNINIYGNIDIIEPYNLTLSSKITLNHGCYINCINPVFIGNDVTISAGVKIISSGIDYHKWYSEHDKKHIYNDGIYIGDHVWIGANAVILPGIKITGKFVTIAANSVVTKNITDDYCVAMGIPARVIIKTQNPQFSNDQI
jgi:acetyltransferase-like isoleucine patch superfamily enzyme